MEDDPVSDGEGEQTVVKEEQGAPEDKAHVCPLTQDAIAPGLSLLCRTGNGLSHAFVKLDLRDKELTDIAALSHFVHLRFLDVSNNHLADLSPLKLLADLLWLKIDNNAVSSFKDQPLGQLPYLQWLSLAGNQLEDMEGLDGTALESLNLIELRGNRLDTTDGIYLPNLRRLYLAQNVIKRLEGLERLERLTTLHLRDNQLETLDGISPSMTSLQYLNVRGNLIDSPKALQSLVPLSSTLRALVVSENPVAETEEYRLEVLTCLTHLERLDKEPISSEEWAEARDRIKELAEEEIPDTDDS
ncbi:unnamed protein product [Merluccius merluccius]